MSRLVDASICPDCRFPLDASARCSGCGLHVTGPLAVRLWEQMVAADTTLEQLRVLVPAVATIPAASAAPGNPFASPVLPAPVPPRRSAVPAVLLGLGGLLLFVGVSLFLAVAWDILPLSIKALMMLAFTGLVAYAAARLTRRGLRASAETVWALTAGLVALDLDAAWASGLAGLDALPGRHVVGVGSVLLLVGGVVVATWARRTPLERLVAPEAVACLATLTLTVSEFWTGRGSSGVTNVVGVVVLGTVAVVLGHRLPLARTTAAVLAGGTWFLLVTHGVASSIDVDTRGGWWRGGDWWRLVAAAVLAAAPASLAVVSSRARQVAAFGALGSLAALALLPVADTAAQALLAAAVVSVLAGLAAIRLAAWSTAAVALGSLLAAAVGGVVLLAAGQGAALALDTLPRWSTAPETRVAALAFASWTLAVAVLAVLGLGFAAIRALPTVGDRLGRVLRRTSPAVLAFTLAVVVARAGVPLWLAATAYTVASVVALVPLLFRAPLEDRAADAMLLGVAALGGVLALMLGSRADLVALGVAIAVALSSLAVTLRADRSARPAVGLAVSVLAVPALVAVGYLTALVADGGDLPRLVTAVLVAAGLLVAAGPALRDRAVRRVTEVTAIGVAGLVVVASLEPEARHTALLMTITGAAIALVAVLRTDRETYGWLASGVLAVATLLRFAQDETAPERYALPVAAVLLVAGVLRLRAAPELGSWRMLGAGLSLALAPSLLLALPDPASVRTLLLGLTAAAVLVVGLQRSWQAPFLAGTTVLVALALRYLLPLAADVLANPLGAWMLFGAAGAACIAAGIWWEQSLRNLRTAGRYVGALT